MTVSGGAITIASGSTITFAITGSSIEFDQGTIQWSGQIASGSSIVVSGSSIAVSGSSFTVNDQKTFEVNVQGSGEFTVKLEVTVNETSYEDIKTIVVQ